jgi:hypothetical protein
MSPSMDTDLAHAEPSRSPREGRNIALAVVLALLVPAVFLVVLVCSGDWQVPLLVLIYILTVSTERFRFTFHSKHGWLIAGAIWGACIGSLPPAISNYMSQTLQSAIHTMEGAILGTVIGMGIDYAKNFPRGGMRMQFRLWYVFAYVAICVLSTFIVLALLYLLRLRSMP